MPQPLDAVPLVADGGGVDRDGGVHAGLEPVAGPAGWQLAPVYRGIVQYGR